MIICFVLLFFLTTLSGIVVKTILDDRREVRTELIRQQVQVLLQDALRRAESLRKVDSAFSGETVELQSPPPATPGLYILTSVYNEDKKVFGIEVRFQDRIGKTVVARNSD